VVTDVRAALHHGVRTDEDVVFDRDVAARDALALLDAAAVRVGRVDRNERADVAVLADEKPEIETPAPISGSPRIQTSG
jgi:hypothetical protein